MREPIPWHVEYFMNLFVEYPKRRKTLVNNNSDAIDWIDQNSPSDCESLGEKIFLLQTQNEEIHCPYGRRKKFRKDKFVCDKKCQCVSDKKRKTLIENYGEDYTSIIQQKTRTTNIEKYGFEFPTQNNQVKEKTKQTSLKKYGKPSYLATKKCQEKTKLANIEKYGTPYYLQSDIGLEKNKKTLQERYGVENAGQLPDHKEKASATSMDRFGYDHAMKSPEIKKKQQDTILEKYSVVNSKQISKDIDKMTEFHSDIEFTEIYQKFDSVLEIAEYFGYTATPIQKRASELGLDLKYSYTSNGQKQIFEFISNLGKRVELNNRSKINPYELDIYLPDDNLAIEYNGVYWHSELFLNDDYHLKKTELCENNGVKLLHISDLEWTCKNSLVKSMLVHQLGMTPKRIYARKCDVVDNMPNAKIREFLDSNHIQGFSSSTKAIGLVFDHELVSLMTFAPSRFDKEITWELIRYCSKQDITVVGGASRLLKSFLSMTDGNIISYADRNFSQGDLYKTLGFTFLGNTSPGYRYLVNGNLESRFKYQKHKLENLLESYDPSKTERENMISNGYYRIYDTGNQKWLYERKNNEGI